MKKNLMLDINIFWLFLIIIYFGSVVLVAAFGNTLTGMFLCTAGIWLFFFCFYKEKRRIVPFALAGSLVTLLIIWKLPSDYQGSFLMKEIIMMAVWGFCERESKSQIDWISYCKIKEITIRQWIGIPALTILFFWIAGYVNAWSVIIFHNNVADSLEEAIRYLPGSLVVLAIVPALMEEYIYRGVIYRSIRQKRQAILLSAFLFAMMHLNFNQMSYAFVMGILFAVLVDKTDNLSVAIMVHMLFNVFNILMPILERNTFLKVILEIHIKSYDLFSPWIIYGSGNISWENVFIGFAVVLAALLLIGGILHLVKAPPLERYEETGHWKPNGYFYFGCAVCLLMAFFSELLHK